MKVRKEHREGCPCKNDMSPRPPWLGTSWFRHWDCLWSPTGCFSDRPARAGKREALVDWLQTRPDQTFALVGQPLPSIFGSHGVGCERTPRLSHALASREALRRQAGAIAWGWEEVERGLTEPGRACAGMGAAAAAGPGDWWGREHVKSVLRGVLF